MKRMDTAEADGLKVEGAAATDALRAAAPKPPAAPPRKRALLLAVAALAAGFGAYKAYNWFTYGRFIVATDDAFFQDPVGRMGIPGVEYFAHGFELPPRIALLDDLIDDAERKRLLGGDDLACQREAPRDLPERARVEVPQVDDVDGHAMLRISLINGDANGPVQGYAPPRRPLPPGPAPCWAPTRALCTTR